MSELKVPIASDHSDFLATIKEEIENRKHFIKYLIIGGSASALDVLLFLVLHNSFGFSPLLAQSIAVPTSVLFSFVINARKNFRTEDYMWLRLLSFSLVCLIGYYAGLYIIDLCVNYGLGANAGKIVSLPFVFILQYLLNSKITFYQLKNDANTVIR